MATITQERQPETISALVTVPPDQSLDPFVAMAPEIPDIELPEEDGEPLESVWHRAQMNLLIDCVKTGKAAKPDFFTGGNMFIYFSLQQVKNKDYKGPDFFYVEGVDPKPNRGKWVVWEEQGKYPDVIIELLSPSTEKIDLGHKKDLYEKVFHTFEYYCYDHDTEKLYGWRLDGLKYQEIPIDENGFMESQILGYKLGVWKGKYLDADTYLRFFQPNHKLVLTQAESERQKAEVEKQKAEVEKQKAEVERQRADQLEKELAELKKQLGKV